MVQGNEIGWNWHVFNSTEKIQEKRVMKRFIVVHLPDLLLYSAIQLLIFVRENYLKNNTTI